MKNLKTIAIGTLATLTLVVAPLAMTRLTARADDMGGGRRGHAFEQLNLSAEQTSQIAAIRADAKSQMQAVLTPEQQTAAAANGDRGWRQLNLSDAQRSQMRSIREASKAKTDAVLTADQRQQLATAEATEHSVGRKGRGDREGKGANRGLDQLNLTADQSAQIEAIRADSRSQMQTIQEAAKSKIDAVLTAEQRQQLAQMHQQKGDRSSVEQ